MQTTDTRLSCLPGLDRLCATLGGPGSVSHNGTVYRTRLGRAYDLRVRILRRAFRAGDRAPAHSRGFCFRHTPEPCGTTTCTD